MEPVDDLKASRLVKLQHLRQKGIQPYGRKFPGIEAVLHVLSNFQEGRQVTDQFKKFRRNIIRLDEKLELAGLIHQIQKVDLAVLTIGHNASGHRDLTAFLKIR